MKATKKYAMKPDQYIAQFPCENNFMGKIFCTNKSVQK
jgi:hypothetical protein